MFILLLLIELSSQFKLGVLSLNMFLNVLEDFMIKPF